jgi:hypothetical protein
MFWTIDKALNVDLVTRDSVDGENGIVKFRLGVIPTLITAHVIKKGAVKYGLEVSHKIKTAGHSLYLPSFRDCNSPGEAVHELIMSFCEQYRSSVNSGHKPKASWLVENPNSIAHRRQEPSVR